MLVVSSAWATDATTKPPMVGHWEGNARIIVSWCHQTSLLVAVDIHEDGTVTGKVGDAMLSKGQLKPNRGWLGRELNLKTDYIISGDLAGAIVAAEGITRRGVNIPLNFNGGNFVGGVHTTGSKFGGKGSSILSASSLTLTRRNAQ